MKYWTSEGLPMTRRHVVSAAAAAWVSGFAGVRPAHGQAAFPDRPLKLVVPWAPGGINDTLARITASRIAAVLGQSIIIDNRSGAAGQIGTQLVAQSPADGYTLLLITSGQHVLPVAAGAKLPYDPLRDFRPFAQIADFPLILAARKSLPARNVAELVTLAKSKPGALNLGSSSQGGIGHLTGEHFMAETGTAMTMVHFRGEAPQIQSMLAGDIDVGMVVNALPQIRDGQLKALGTTGLQRWEQLPDVPTIAEQGLPGFEALGWCGLAVSAKTPSPVVDALARAARMALTGEELRIAIPRLGAQPRNRTPDEVAALMEASVKKYRSLVASRNIKLEN